MTLTASLRSHLEGIERELVALRRDLHQIPEVGLDLPDTRRRLLEALEGLPLDITLGEGCTSITAVLRGTAPSDAGERPVVLLRGDMDGLPVEELTGLDFASVNGNMHACGHDLHMALLVGAVRALCEHRDRLPGDVVFMFQPGEEGFDGASVMIAEGVLDAAGRRPDAAYAIHVFSALEPHGIFATRPGAMMAASDEIHVVVTGRGGHGSAPHLAVDPVPALAQMVLATQVLVGRRVDVFDPAVISVGKLQAGTRSNVIPESGEFEATLRTFSSEQQDNLFRLIPETMRGIAASNGVGVEVELRHQYPVTVNDPDHAEAVVDAVADVFGSERAVVWTRPLTGSEDFSRVLAEVPGAFIALSAVPERVDPLTAPYNHSAYAVFDDGVVADGALLLAELACRTLGAE
ncbi:MAG TPA: M20 family metallopeptidase [Propionibacteriaceae bacterium]|nr:M20 family metallopeptidase [Propionibacteriaceae bacterium]